MTNSKGHVEHHESSSHHKGRKHTSVESNAAFNVPRRIIFKVFIDADEMTRLALGAKAEFIAEKDSAFSWFNHKVFGRFDHIEPEKSLKLQMRLAEWPESATSCCEIKFEPIENDSSRCKIKVEHTKIPVLPNQEEHQVKSQIEEMWESAFWDKLDKVFGYGREKDLDD